MNNENSKNANINVKRKTRVEDLEERLITAENLISGINEDLKNEGKKEINKLSEILLEVQEMKEKIKKQSEEDNQTIDNNPTEITMNSLLLINNDKLKVNPIHYHRLWTKMKNSPKT